MNPLVTVVIPCFNYGEYIQEAVDSVLNSTYRNLEIIIVDDGSTDPYTKDVLKFMGTNSMTRVISRINGGLSAARNTGIENACGKYILTLDADDKIHSSLIEKAVWILENKKDIAYVFSLVQLFGEANKIWETFQADLLYLKFRNVVPATIVMRKECWDSIGGYDESMRDGYEDWEFVIRLAKSNFAGFHINELLFFYRKHKGSMLEGSKRKNSILKQIIRDKHPDLYYFRLFEFIRFILFELFRRGSISFKGIVKKIFAVLPSIIKEMIKYNRFRKYYFKTPYETDKLLPIQVSNKKKSTKTIMIILPWIHVGGVEKVFLNLVNSLYLKYEIILVTTKSSKEHPWSFLFQPNVKALYHLGDFLQDEKDKYLFLSYLIERWSVDLIHISNSQFGYNSLPCIKKQFPNITVIETLHMEEPWSAWDYFDYSHQYRSYIDKTITLTNSQYKSLISRDPSREHKVTSISNGVSLVNSDKIKAEYFTIGFIGRLVDQKQPVAFLKIAKQIKKTKLPIKFLIVGEGELLNKVKLLRKIWGLEGLVDISPFSNEVIKILGQIHVLLIPSLREGLPMVGIEAMSQGVPIIASNVSGWNDLIVDGETGYLCSNDYKDFSVKIINLYNNKEIYNSFSKNSLNRYLEKYQLKDMVSSYSQVYDELIYQYIEGED